MFSPYSFDSQVIIQTLTRTYDGVGNTDVWVNTKTLWGSIIQPSNNRYVDVFVLDGQRLAKNIIYKLVVREQQQFEYASTRFIWKSRFGNRILKPIQAQLLPGHRHSAWSAIFCEDITNMSSPV